jgi:Concanavalin A-like lectin/glucanases superfamily/Immunoglobulin I-set domain
MKRNLRDAFVTFASTLERGGNPITNMKKITTLIWAGTMAMFCCSSGYAQSYSNSLAGATLIYSNSFNGGSVSIHGTAPTVANSILGGTNTAKWNSVSNNVGTGAYMYQDGTIGPIQDSFLLPFTPRTNYVYTMSASVNLPVMASGRYITMGFSQFNPVNSSAPRFGDAGVFGNPWMYATAVAGSEQLFVNRSTLIANAQLMPTAGTHTLQMVLDTTGTRWTTAAFVDGVQLGTNYPYASNPTISAAGVGLTTLPSSAGIQWNYWALSAAPLVITKPPVSAGVASGGAFTNTVTVAATTPSYQWYQDGQPLPRPGQTNLINGATNASLILNPVHPEDASANYYVVVTNSLGSVTSDPVSLSVYSAPVIAAAYPVTYTNGLTLYGATTVGGTDYPGSTPTFSMSVIGAAPIYYKWLTNGVAVSGATNSSFTFTNCPLNGPTSFTCVVTNMGGAATNTWSVSYLPAPTAPFPKAVLTYQPVGYWRLNEGSDDGFGDNGMIAIDYAAGNDGIYTNAILGNGGYSPSTDPGETSALFSSYASPDSDVFGIQGIDFAAPTNTSATFSVEAWVEGFGTAANGAGIIAKGYSGAEQFALDLNSNKYRFLVRDAAGNPYSVTATFGPDGGWHFVTGICDEVNGAISLYVDGVLAGSAPIPSNAGLLSSPRLTSIGARSSSSTSGNDLQFRGYINDVAAFNYALSPGQVVAQYSGTASIPPYFSQLPPPSITVNAGDTLNLPALAAGTTSVGYYWTDVNTGTTVAAGTTNGLPLNASLTVNNVPASWNSDQLELTVTNAAGSTNVFVSLTVLTNVTIANDLPISLSLVSGTSYTYSIGVAGAPPFHYQWYKAGVPIANQTSSAYTVTVGAPGSSSTYSVVVSNAYVAVTSSVSTLTSIAQPTNAYPAAILQLNPAGYWPMHEVEAAAQGNLETNYGTLGLLGTAYYPDWAADAGAFTRQVPGAIAGDADNTALHFNYNVGNLANGAGTWTNELYVPHTSPLSTLTPPFSVECWVYSTNTSQGTLNQGIWGQHGFEGLNAGYAGNGTGLYQGMQLAYNSSGTITIYGYYNSVQTAIVSYTGAPLNNWYHLVVACDANTNFTLYVNGTEQAIGAGAGKYAPDYWTPLTIGGTRGGTRSACVTVDEFAVYTNVISDVSAHYNDGIGGGAGVYFQDVTNDNPVIYLRMDAPVYTAPGIGTWPELVNYGSTANPGVYTPGTMPGIVTGPATTDGISYIGLSGTNVAALSGISSFADAGYATAYNPTGSNANFTVTALFRGNPSDNRVQSIVSHGTNSWQLNITTNGCIVFNAGNGNTATSGTGSNPGDIKTTGVYNDGKWHQVVAINSTNVVSIYVDGVLDTNGTPAGITPTSVIPGNPGNVMIGSDPSYTNNPAGVGRQFAGQVCEVAFLNQALSATQVQNLHQIAVTGSAVNSNPANLLFSVVDGQLMLSWPSDHIGWTLQVQTNNLGVGLSTDWVDVPGSTSTNQFVFPINPANGSVFYRLRYQP